ncbi:MAG: hypothetical protein H7Z14_16665 [Anaerolineae bacterium]|nr:hypothetical protein [Phycisphaerae bacterium]
MKRAIVIVAAIWFLALGSGAAEYLHNAQHAREDASLSHPDQPERDHEPVHDDSNCSVHAQLHQPLVAPWTVAMLICAGLFVAFLTQLAPVYVPTRLPARIDCRGPPACR